MSDEIFVYISLEGKNILVGRQSLSFYNGKENFSFEYDETWLSHPERFFLEPLFLQLTTKTDPLSATSQQHTPNLHMARAISPLASQVPSPQGGRNERNLDSESHQVDYILAINDKIRYGALRFSKVIGGEFLGDSVDNSVSSFENLTQLIKLSGNSLNSKVAIIDIDDSLSIAKFSDKNDKYNSIAWEAVALELAKKAGINVPVFRLEKILGKSILITKRFDRNNKIRIPFLSAMNMLGQTNNSYLEIAYAILQHGAQPKQDLEELWRRIVFSVLISNPNDHLRNYGFLYESQRGWKLSPIYDVNPTPNTTNPRVLSTTINLTDKQSSIKLALSVIKDFRLSEKRAKAIIGEVASAISNWRNVSKSFGISLGEREEMLSAFDHKEMELAKKYI